MEVDRWPKRAFQYAPQNRKRRRAPATTWIKVITKIRDEDDW